MRAFWISLAALGLLLCADLWFIRTVDTGFHRMSDMILNETIPLVASEDWEAAGDSVARLTVRWYDQEKLCSIFMDAGDLSEVELALARLRGSLEAEEAGPALEELYGLEKQLTSLYKNELLSLENMI